ncbi:hypothetical protein FCU94_00435 [Vibrio sp. JPW-9-11-11]|uniref:hypothetical protein n=1 Tax=Vibrio sp. JPW-9-11-11 TaxID=1416532 RepID=UPI00159432C2|nr:hypothetical protein [Vibrio sp. JPW-9-11-11]NVD05386.1 hypothetical protein [Vibrio sp. JPW-9-11-11]
MKKFVYLVQGRSSNVDVFFSWESEDADIIILTWDKEKEGCIFYPNSTWATGRNRLLSEALERDDYMYFIFMDEDVDFTLGSHKDLERCLIEYQPLIGAPVQFKSSRLQHIIDNIPLLSRNKVQYQYHIDEQLQAFHRDALKEELLLPYRTTYDDVCWWYNTELLQYIIRDKYHSSSLQFNNIEIINEQHIDYPQSYDLETANNIIDMEVGPGNYRRRLIEVGMGKHGWLMSKFIILYHLICEYWKSAIK